jgi:hypothetical protein
MQPAAPSAATNAYYRIQEPQSGLYVRFNCIAAARSKTACGEPQLTQRDRATRFVRYSAAVEYFGRCLIGQPFEIVRCDA